MRSSIRRESLWIVEVFYVIYFLNISNLIPHSFRVVDSTQYTQYTSQPSYNYMKWFFHSKDVDHFTGWLHNNCCEIQALEVTGGWGLRKRRTIIKMSPERDEFWSCYLICSFRYREINPHHQIARNQIAVFIFSSNITNE